MYPVLRGRIVSDHTAFAEAGIKYRGMPFPVFNTGIRLYPL